MSKAVQTAVFQLGATNWFADAADPSAGAGVPAAIGSWYIRTTDFNWYRKVGAADTDWYLLTGGSSAFYGFGAAGNVTLPVGDTLLSQDMDYDTLIIPAGARLIPRGWRIYCATELIVEAGGSIDVSGSSATTFAFGTAVAYNGPISPGTAGGNGGLNNGSAGTGGTTLTNIPAGMPLTTGAGGSGGNGATGTGAAKAGSTTGRRSWDAWCMLVEGFADYGSPVPANSHGGGGGGGDGVNRGGGGGGSGGRIILAATRIRNDGDILSTGGDGAPGQGGNTGGGGGGGGGAIWILTRQYIGTAPVNTGGTGGAGSGTGTAGADGGDGQLVICPA